jgi:hypothetical protein
MVLRESSVFRPSSLLCRRRFPRELSPVLIPLRFFACSAAHCTRTLLHSLLALPLMSLALCLARLGPCPGSRKLELRGLRVSPVLAEGSGMPPLQIARYASGTGWPPLQVARYASVSCDSKSRPDGHRTHGGGTLSSLRHCLRATATCH